MTGLLVNMIGGLFLVAALGILGLVVYNSVANAYRETVLADVEERCGQAPKHRRYGHFLWRLVYPVLAVVSILLKTLAMIAVNTENPRRKSYYCGDGTVWCRNEDGSWYNSNTGEIAPNGPPY